MLHRNLQILQNKRLKRIYRLYLDLCLPQPTQMVKVRRLKRLLHRFLIRHVQQLRQQLLHHLIRSQIILAQLAIIIAAVEGERSHVAYDEVGEAGGGLFDHAGDVGDLGVAVADYFAY